MYIFIKGFLPTLLSKILPYLQNLLISDPFLLFVELIHHMQSYEVLPSHMKSTTICFTSLNTVEGTSITLARYSKDERANVFTIVILPFKDRFLHFQLFSKFFMFNILFLNSLTSVRVFTRMVSDNL